MRKETLKDQMNPAEFKAFLQKQEAGRNSKFGAIRKETNDGKMADSTWEATFYNTLLLLERIGEVEKFEYQVTFEIVVNHVHVCNYRLDFRITYTPKSPEFVRYQGTGGVRYVDTKSPATITEGFRMKQKLMMACHGIVVEAVVDPSLKPKKLKNGKR